MRSRAMSISRAWSSSTVCRRRRVNFMLAGFISRACREVVRDLPIWGQRMSLDESRCALRDESRCALKDESRYAIFPPSDFHHIASRLLLLFFPP
eukprot:4866252-Pleurochrysis_carterae.AAC.2